jgi:hypothetical protein
MQIPGCNEPISECNDEFHIPTPEEYEVHKKEMATFASWIRMSRDRQDKLLDELTAERESYKLYLSTYNRHKEEVRKYEIYKQIQEEKGSC